MQSIFSLLQFQRNLILLFLWYKTLCKTKKQMNSLYIIPRSCLLGKWMIFSWLLPSRIRVSTQIMVHNYCTAKNRKFSTSGRLLMALQAIFLWLKIFALITTLQEYGKLKSIPSQVYFTDFVHRYRTAF